MTDSMFTAKARTDLDGRCPEPVETVLLVHPSGRRKKVFGRKQLASRLGINNYLVLTPTHLRLFTLGGRAGTKPKDEIGLKVKDDRGAWPRSQVQVRMEMAERSSFMASTGSSLEWRVFCLQLSGPDLDVSVDVRADGGLFVDDDDFMAQEGVEAEVQETIDMFREEAAITTDTVDTFVRALAPA